MRTKNSNELQKAIVQYSVKKARQAKALKKSQKCSWIKIAKYMGVTRATLYHWFRIEKNYNLKKQSANNSMLE